MEGHGVRYEHSDLRCKQTLLSQHRVVIRVEFRLRINARVSSRATHSYVAITCCPVIHALMTGMIFKFDEIEGRLKNLNMMHKHAAMNTKISRCAPKLA